MSQRDPATRVVPTRNGVQYTPEQWAEKRDVITQLYARDAKSLREVKELMRISYDFRPTDRMYQRKIKQWHLDKKHKAPEMKAILRLTRQHEATGQPSVFRIRGRHIDIEEVRRYFKRKGEDVTKIDVGNVPIPPSISVDPPNPQPHLAASPEIFDDNDAVEFSFSIRPDQRSSSLCAMPGTATSVPFSGSQSSPGSRSSSGSSTRSDSVLSTPLVLTQGTLACQMIPNFPNMALPIDLTFGDQCSRILLSLTQLFLDAVVPADFWSEDLSNGGCHLPWRRTLSAWSRATSEGHELLQRGQTRESFALRGKAMDSVPKHITNTSPIILFRYFEIIHALCASGDEGFLLVTLRHVLAMSRKLLPVGHPIWELTRLLLHPQARSIIGPLVHQGISKSLDILYERCGKTHPRILYVLDSRTQTFLDEREYQKATVEAEKYLELAQQIRGDRTFEVCQAQRMLGDAYVATDCVEEAESAYTEALRLNEYLESAEDRGFIGVKAHRGIASIARSQGRPLAAQEHLQTALQIGTDAFGPSDAQVMLVQDDLNGFHLHDQFS